jgi:predicted RNase H-like HicB family nuclease
MATAIVNGREITVIGKTYDEVRDRMRRTLQQMIDDSEIIPSNEIISITRGKSV